MHPLDLAAGDAYSSTCCDKNNQRKLFAYSADIASAQIYFLHFNKFEWPKQMSQKGKLNLQSGVYTPERFTSVDSICNIKATNLVNGPMKSSAGEIFQSPRGHCVCFSLARRGSHFGEMVMNGRISFRSGREPQYKSPFCCSRDQSGNDLDSRRRLRRRTPSNFGLEMHLCRKGCMSWHRQKRLTL